MTTFKKMTAPHKKACGPLAVSLACDIPFDQANAMIEEMQGYSVADNGSNTVAIHRILKKYGYSWVNDDKLTPDMVDKNVVLCVSLLGDTGATMHVSAVLKDVVHDSFPWAMRHTWILKHYWIK